MTTQEDIETLKAAQQDIRTFREQLKKNNRNLILSAIVVSFLLGLVVGVYIGYVYPRVTVEQVVPVAEPQPRESLTNA